MMERRYYFDSYTVSFQAHVIQRYSHNGHLALVLDETYFYPTSGGQPADTGSVNGQPVLDVFIRDEDDAIVHVLAGEVWSDEVTCAIDWERRFDHMQQHTGQHILSQSFIRVGRAHTVGFHLSQNSVTIDLDDSELEPTDVKQAELLANQLVWENRLVRVRLVTPDEALALQLRRLPPPTRGIIRLVDIDEFDLTPCGGTHVSHTGEIGIIKVVKVERHRGKLRVEFCCGKRALADYRRKNNLVNKLSADLSTGFWQLDDAVAGLREQIKEAQREARQRNHELLTFVAQDLLAASIQKGIVTVVSHAFDNRSPEDVRILANLLIQRPGVIALLGAAGAKSHLVFARSNDAPGEMNQLIKNALSVLGNAAGGGTESFAQGGGAPADIDRVEQALNRAERLLLARIQS